MSGLIAEERTLRVLIMREGDYYVAQGIELDLVAHARTQDEVKIEFYRVLVGTTEGYKKRGKDIFDVVPRAPKVYEDAYVREQYSANWSPPAVNYGFKTEARVLVGRV